MTVFYDIIRFTIIDFTKFIFHNRLIDNTIIILGIDTLTQVTGLIHVLKS